MKFTIEAKKPTTTCGTVNYLFSDEQKIVEEERQCTFWINVKTFVKHYAISIIGLTVKCQGYE